MICVYLCLSVDKNSFAPFRVFRGLKNKSKQNFFFSSVDGIFYG